MSDASTEPTAAESASDSSTKREMPDDEGGETRARKRQNTSENEPEAADGVPTETPSTDSAAPAAEAPANGAADPAAPPVPANGAPFAADSQTVAATAEAVMVPNSQVGAILGRQGATIMALRASSGAHISVEESDANMMRKVILTGAPSQIQHAKQLISDKLAEQQTTYAGAPAGGVGAGGIPPQRQAHGGGMGPEAHPPVGSPMQRMMPDGTMEVRIGVPTAQIGGIIGKGGNCINGIRSASGATIKVTNANEMPPGSEQRTLVLTGPGYAVEHAKNLVIAKLDEIPHRETPVPERYGSTQYDPSASQGFAGYTPEQLQQFAAYAMSSAGHQRTAENVSVPDEYMGRVIGRGGAHIGEVRRHSGSHIDIHQTQGPGVPRLITLTGTPQQRQVAKCLIQAQIYQAQQFMVSQQQQQPGVPGGGMPMGAGPPQY